MLGASSQIFPGAHVALELPLGMATLGKRQSSWANWIVKLTVVIPAFNERNIREVITRGRSVHFPLVAALLEGA
jgi:hypothetical protein